MTQVFAHRGASGYAPENTLEAFELAHQQGAAGIELDVHLTRDKQVIVAHDERIDRVSTGIGLISSLTVKEIKKHLFNKTHPEYTQAKAPLLEEVLDFLADKDMKVNIELKNSRIPYPGMEEKCLELVARAGLQGRVLYSSFNHHSMRRISSMDQDAVCGLLYDCSLLSPDAYWQAAGVRALHPHYADVLMHPEAYMKVLEQGGLLNVWTVNDDRDMRKVADLGVSSIITNFPDRAIAALL